MINMAKKPDKEEELTGKVTHIYETTLEIEGKTLAIPQEKRAYIKEKNLVVGNEVKVLYQNGFIKTLDIISQPGSTPQKDEAKELHMHKSEQPAVQEPKKSILEQKPVTKPPIKERTDLSSLSAMNKDKTIAIEFCMRLAADIVKHHWENMPPAADKYTLINRDLEIVHSFQQSGLRARRCAVYLIGQNDVGEKRAGQKL